MIKMKITFKNEKTLTLPINYIRLENEKIIYQDEIYQRPKNWERQELEMEKIEKIELVEI